MLTAINMPTIDQLTALDGSVTVYSVGIVTIINKTRVIDIEAAK